MTKRVARPKYNLIETRGNKFCKLLAVGDLLHVKNRMGQIVWTWQVDKVEKTMKEK